jgi:hypothetical protein
MPPGKLGIGERLRSRLGRAQDVEQRWPKPSVDSVCHDGLIEALELHLPDRFEVNGQAAAAKQSHDIGDEYLSALGGVAQAPGDDDRRTEQIGAVVDRLASIDTNA